MITVPNLFTLFNLLCGFIAIFYAVTGHYLSAGMFILLGTIFDFLDGYASRLFHQQSDFGGQLDSFADLITFGLAPAVMVFASNHNSIGFAYKAILFLYLCAIVYRLADYNTEKHGADFRGLPSTFSGGFLAFVFIWSPDFFMRSVSALLFLGLALLSVSPLPYAKIEVKKTSYKIVLFFAILAGVVFQFYVIWFVVFGIYLLSGFIIFFKKPTPEELSENLLHPGSQN